MGDLISSSRFWLVTIFSLCLRFSLIILFVLLNDFTHKVYAQSLSTAPNVIHINEASEHVLGNSLYTFPDGELSWQEVVNLPISAGIQSKVDFYNSDQYGFPIWIRTDLKTGSLNPKDEWVLGLGSGFTGDIEFFLVANGELLSHQENLLTDTFEKRAIQNRFLYFPMDLPSGSDVTLLLKINFSPIPHHRPVITTVDLLEEDEIFWMTWIGFAIGFLAAIGFYHLVLASATQDLSYVFYFLYIVGSASWFAITHGLEFSYLWPNIPAMSVYLSAFMYYSPILASYFFVIHFLHLHKLSPRLTRFLYGQAILLSFLIILKVLIPAISINLLGLVAIVSYFSFIYAGFYARKKGLVYANYFILAWTLYCISVVNMILYVSGLPSLFPGNTYWVVVIVFDIQAILLALALAHRIRSMRNAQIEAEADNRAQSEFLARMSHEIRTPLNGVLGMAELLVERLKDKTDLYYVNIIRTSGSSLLTIINDILDYSKFSSGKMELENIPFNLQRLAVESFDVFKVKAAEKNVELITDFDFDIPKVVMGDPTRIKQIMLNFISNALKFTDSGEIVLRLSPVAFSEDTIKISVSDTGLGISEQGQQKLFTAFSQVSSSVSRQYGGTGLGLSICKQLATLMGGQIGVESEKGKGSTFWVTLKLPPSSVVLGDDKVDELSLKGYRLLIVEDNYTFAELLYNQACTWGMNCQVATNGKEALALLRQNNQAGAQFDLISLDLAMPVMDGIETSKQIYADDRFKHIPMLLLTSATNFPSKSVLEATGIQRVMEKPTLPADIERAYKELIFKDINEPKSISLTPSIDEHRLPELTILVAEDNKVNQLVIKGLLKRLKQSFVIVEDGEEAVNAIKNDPEKYDLILMDYNMPNMNGVNATKAIREWEAQEQVAAHKIVALTAHAVQEFIDECMSAGMNDYLSKPIDLEKVESLINRMFVLDKAYLDKRGV